MILDAVDRKFYQSGSAGGNIVSLVNVLSLTSAYGLRATCPGTSLERPQLSKG